MALLLFLLAAFAVSALAQAKISGPGFDPTPVQITEVGTGGPRPITNLDLLTIRDVHGLSISPDGKYVAFVMGQAVLEANSYRTGLFLVSTAPSSPLICLGTAGMPQWDPIGQWMEEAPQWSSDSQYIMHRMRMSETEKWQVWRWNRSGGPPEQLTQVNGDVQRYDLSPDGSAMLLTVRYAPDPGEARKLEMDGILYDGSFALNRRGSFVDEVISNRPLPTEAWIYSFADKEERKASEKELQAFGPWESDLDEKVFDKFSPVPKLEGHHIIDAKISPDKRLVAYRFLPKGPLNPQASLYWVFTKPVRGGSPVRVQLPPDAYFVMDYWWSSDSKLVYYIYIDGHGHSPKLMVAAATGATLHQVFRASDFLFSWSADRSAHYLACYGASARQPGKIVLIDLSTGSFHPLIDLNPEFENIRLSEQIRISGLNKLGDAWFAHLVLPLNYESGKRYPTIVTTYRSGDYFLRGASGDESPIHVYAANGFAVLSFDMGRDRQIGIKAGSFEDFLASETSVLSSIEMALQKGVELGIVDPGRVGITGYSRGTEQVAYAITHTDLFQAGSGAAGDTSPFFYNMAPDATKKGPLSTFGLNGWPEGEVKARWKQVAPDLNANQIHTPVLNNDPDSEAIGDMALYTALRELGKPMELFIYPDELHHINQPRHRYWIYERNLDWFRFWLKSEKAADEWKKEQYARWDALRELQNKGNTAIENSRDAGR